MKEDLKLYFNNREKIKELNQFIIQYQLKHNELIELKNLTLKTGYLYDIKIDKDLDFFEQEINSKIKEINDVLGKINDKKLLNLIKKIDNLYLSNEDIQEDISCLPNRISKTMTLDRYSFENYVYSYRRKPNQVSFNDLLKYLFDNNVLDDNFYNIINEFKNLFEKKHEKELSNLQYIKSMYFTPLQVFSILNYYDIISDDYFAYLIQQNFVTFDKNLIIKTITGSEIYKMHLKNIAFIISSYYNKKQYTENIKEIIKSIDEQSYLDFIKK